ncbi:hypothetical protein [Aliikangiella coralliicola]|nr:hypothetical protein [Aliikangiella coralliicola]
MNTINRIGLAALLGGALMACTSESGQRVVSQVEKSPVSHTYSKPGAPITMTYNVLTSSPKAGEEIEIEVSFKSAAKSSVKSEMASAKKLTWLNGNTNWTSQLQKSGQRESLPVLKVIAPQNGIYYINLVASVEQDGKTMAKPFTIPVKVGEGPFELAPVGEVVTDEKGQRVIVQKAESNN